MEALIGKCTRDQGIKYKVLWRGYPEEVVSWEPLANLNCPDLIQEYEASGGGGGGETGLTDLAFKPPKYQQKRQERGMRRRKGEAKFEKDAWTDFR